MDDEHYMMLAIEEAQKAERIDEVPVGAVLVNENGQITGTGFNRPVSTSDPTSHAEINAIRNAAQKAGNYRLPGTCLYVTIEPCIMCMGAIIHSRINRLVFGAPDPKWGAAGSLYNMPADQRLNHRLEVVSGICEDQARTLIQRFFAKKRSR